MNIKVIVSILIGTVVVIGGFIWSSQQSSGLAGQPSSDPSALVSDSQLYDFGTISMAKGEVAHSFKIRNTSQESLSIKQVYTSCMCTLAEVKIGEKTYGPFGMQGHGGATATNIELSPGQEVELNAIYDPNAHGPAGAGAIDRYLYLQDEKGAQLRIEIKANVTP